MFANRRVTFLFGMAVVTAILTPFAVSAFLSKSNNNNYYSKEVAELSRPDMQYVAQQVVKYCQAPMVETVISTPPTDTNAPSVPVILYHRITDRDAPSHEVTRPALFREHLEWLKSEGYETITVAQLTSYMQGTGSIPTKPIVLTFDDGWKDNVEAAKTLKEFNFGATFYVISGFFEHDMYFDEEELVTLSKDSKFEIGSHTHSHFVKWETKLNQLDLCTMATEMAASKRLLERLIKKPVTTIAWPYGYNTGEAIYIASQLGYSSTMHVNRDTINQPGHSPLFTRRLNVDGTCPLSDFQQMVRSQTLKECS